MLISPFATVICSFCRADWPWIAARLTEPSTIEYSLPWQGHWIRPLLIWVTGQPWCVQIDEKP